MILPCDQQAADPHQHQAGERAATLVLWLTVVAMIGEIGAGWLTGSMALLAEGWHMGLHAAAMGIAVFAYRFIRRHRTSGRYSFGAGKAGDLAGFANAVMLAVVSVLIAAESVTRLFTPEPIAFGPALLVAAIGLGVNLLSAFLLHDDHEGHAGGHDHSHHHHDSNRRAAFVHVLSDALTSVLAIVALLCARYFGWIWMDALMGLVGGAVILRWSLQLARQTADLLLDAVPDPSLAERIVAIAREHGDEVRDLHLWRIAPGRIAATLSVRPSGRDDYRHLLSALPGITHLTLERSAAPVAPPSRAHEHRHHH